MTETTAPVAGGPADRDFGSSIIRFLVELPAAVLILVMMLHVTVNAVMREFLGSSIPYTLELVTYWYMPALALLGAVAATHHRGHIDADLVFSSLPESSKRWVVGIVLVSVTTLMFALAWYGWEEAVHAFEIRKRAAVTPLPAWPVYFLVPLAFGAMTLQFGRQAVGMLRGTIPVDPDIDADDALALGAEPSHQPTIPSENR